MASALRIVASVVSTSSVLLPASPAQTDSIVQNRLGASALVAAAAAAPCAAPDDPGLLDNLGVPENWSGNWTQFAPSVDTRVLYVSSSSGNDFNDGLTESTPKRTIAAAKGLLRHGYPDWLLLERGNVFHESLGQWKISGRSSSEPMLVSTYGTALERPLLKTGLLGGMWTNGGSGSAATIDNLAVVGIHFYANGYLGAGDCVGARMLQPGSNFLIEDCKFEGYSVNLVFQGFGGRHTDFRLRRSVIVDAYAIHAIGGHSQGLYAYGVDGLLLEENLFDHNGWNENVAGAGADIFSHNIYIDNDNTSVEVRGNCIANASSHGMQLRCGGTVVNNVFVRNSIALSVGGGNNPELGGVTAFVDNNAIIDGKDINSTTPRGWGMWFANISSGMVSNNLLANNTLGTQPNVMMIDGDHMGDTHPSIGVHNLTVTKNVFFNWAGSVRIEGDTWQITNVEFSKNDVQSTNSTDILLDLTMASTVTSLNSWNNRFHSSLAPVNNWTRIGSSQYPMSYWLGQVGDSTSMIQQAAYGAPTRSPATYNTRFGGVQSLDAYLNEARQQSSTNWRTEYMARPLVCYLRRGF